jgi:hypothetical protein
LAAGSVLFLTTWALLAGAGAVLTPEPTRAHRRFWATIALLLLLSAVEEVAFRGGLLGWGGRVVGTPAALAVSSMGFAASHAFPTRLSLTTWVNLTLYGVLFGLAYLVGGLPASIALHGSWNAWEWGLGFTVSGPSTSHLLPAPPVRRPLRGTPYGPEGHWAATVTCLLSVGATLAVLRPGGL